MKLCPRKYWKQGVLYTMALPLNRSWLGEKKLKIKNILMYIIMVW
jgi:hypothetical protein